MTELSPRDLKRYSRQIMLPSWGEEGQRKLSRATVGVMGVGGLGSPASIYLAAAGVGRIILADDQAPDLSNLNRQVLHWEKDVSNSTPKVESAASKLRELNQDITVETRAVRVTEGNIQEVFQEADVVIDCLDDFSPRYILNQFCVMQSKPFVHGAVEGFNGQVTTIVPGKSPCLKCVFPNPPPKKREFPIMGATAGIFGVLEASEAIKLITGIGQPLVSRLLVGDILYQEWDIIEVCRAETCPVCRHL